MSGLPPPAMPPPSSVLAEIIGRKLAKEKCGFQSLSPNTINKMRRVGLQLRDDGSIFSTECSSHAQNLQSGDAPANWTSSPLDFLAQLIQGLLVATGQETKEMLTGQDISCSPTPIPLLSHHLHMMWKLLRSKEYAVYFQKPPPIERS